MAPKKGHRNYARRVKLDDSKSWYKSPELSFIENSSNRGFYSSFSVWIHVCEIYTKAPQMQSGQELFICLLEWKLLVTFSVTMQKLQTVFLNITSCLRRKSRTLMHICSRPLIREKCKTNDNFLFFSLFIKMKLLILQRQSTSTVCNELHTLPQYIAGF